MITRLTVFFFMMMVSVCISSCSQELVYNTAEKVYKFGDIQVEPSLKAIPGTEKMFLVMKVVNNSSRNIVLDYSQTGLITEEGYMNIPEDFNKAESFFYQEKRRI